MHSRYARSMGLWDEASRVMVPGSATISKHPKLATLGAYPIYARSARGAELTDLDGNTLIDFGSALGAVILGYNEPRVTAAVRRQLEDGVLFSLSTPGLVELGRRICERVPSIERVRILKNGSDAASAATRVARGATGRSKIAVCHYHGWHDWFYVSTALGRGIPPSFGDQVFSFPYNDMAAVSRLIEERGHEIAAFMVEPVQFDEPRPGYLDELRSAVQANGSLLIFDEVVTGFRFGLGGAQEYFGVLPDLTCLAKALGNGFPIAAVGGRAEIMDATADIITTMTYGEEALSAAAAVAVLEILSAEPVHRELWRLGALFKKQFNELSEKYEIPISCTGYPVRMDLRFGSGALGDRKMLKAFFLQETAKRGVLLSGHVFINYAHTDAQLKQALEACAEVFSLLSRLGELSADHLQGGLTEELW